MKNILLAGFVLASAALAGCASTTTHEPEASDPLLLSVQQSADSLAAQLSRHKLKTPIIVASAQNNDQLTQVCQQGRLISDIVSSRLTQQGLAVTEVRLGQTLRINKEGETILSRELGVLAKEAKAEVVVTSTWTTVTHPAAVIHADSTGGAMHQPTPGQTYVTLKAVRIADGLVLSSQTFAPPASWTCN